MPAPTPAAPDIDDDVTEARADFDGEFEFDTVRIEGGDQTNAVGEGTINTAIVERVDLTQAKLGPLTLANVLLRNVELSNASLQRVVARRTAIRASRAIGLKLSLDLAMDLSVEDCRLDYAILNVEKVKGVAVFRGCTFREATISGDLSNVRFQDCDFVETEFRVTRAAKCDLRSSRIDSSKGLLSLRGAMISPEQAVAISGMIAAEAGLIVVS
jgi:uncharacterized protein YjbI with pentapeptide repeats